jgi:hypothetical protein
MLTIELTPDQAATLLVGMHPRSVPTATRDARWSRFQGRRERRSKCGSRGFGGCELLDPGDRP